MPNPNKKKTSTLKRDIILVVFTAIITVLITTFANCILWNYQHEMIKSEKLLDNQYQLLEQFIQL